MFKAVLEKGKSMKSPPLSLRYLPFDASAVAEKFGPASTVDTSRLGFIVRKKTGNAVMRNSIRRVLREVFRARLGRMPNPTWFVFDVLPQASGITKRTLRLKGEDLLERVLKQMETRVEASGPNPNATTPSGLANGAST
jgi:ribonuclease P protein component